MKMRVKARKLASRFMAIIILAVSIWSESAVVGFAVHIFIVSRFLYCALGSWYGSSDVGRARHTWSASRRNAAIE